MPARTNNLPSGLRAVFRVFCCTCVAVFFCIAGAQGDFPDINGSAANSSSPSFQPPNTPNATLDNRADNINVTDLLRNVSSTGLDSLSAVLLLAKDYSTGNLSVLETTLKQLNKSSVVFLEIVIKGPEYITNTGPSYILKDNSSLALGYGSTYGETKAIVFGPTIGRFFGSRTVVSFFFITCTKSPLAGPTYG
ncbi:hypothetical protein RvY_05672 [Ramazzottius varieornatus]|uniref:Uncharacterized protein n=1 Tax=Ramazzottius varieornatus TaxID=947166 RepID=A0A1D1UVW1_RAMVA|nr:hypothetical protein RvY_05672 [Ramazzottius varieornatus]